MKSTQRVQDKPQINLFWFRRDLRLHDNAGLYHALQAGLPVLPLFIYDAPILDDLEDKLDRRVEFIYQSLLALQKQLMERGSSLITRYGDPIGIFKELEQEYDIRAIYANEDYEPYAIRRDRQIQKLSLFKDQVLLHKDEVVKENGKPYTVYTPYYNKWRSVLTEANLQSFKVEKLLGNLYQHEAGVLSPETFGFRFTKEEFPPARIDEEILAHYQEQRNLPSVQGTSRLGVHLRFGTISIRELARKAIALNETFLKELAWREFFQMILWHFPGVVNHSYKKVYDNIIWRNDEKDFKAWCAGKTGYPMVDAGMRELHATGFMHNRVRMVAASFLTKHLLIDWRWGESYFAKKLLDYELASNNGNWQWAAGSGCDAAPYFRLFNPSIQAKKFDPQLLYIKKWIPELERVDYPAPIVDHDWARQRCLRVYSDALKK